MSDAKTILILRPSPELRPEASGLGAGQLADALHSLGAEVLVHDMTAQYDEVLDAVARAATIVVWR